MPALALTILKYLFLALIFLFLARAVRAMYLEISGPRTPKSPAAPAPATGRSGKPPDKVALLVGGEKPKLFDLGDELILGRSGKCHIVLGDTYASQVHARVFRRNGQFFLEDMGSTNGTYLNSRKVTAPTPVNRGDRARIGRTELEFRR
ncbi:MAG TPA: FHA domain-containing protein [Actinomycetota bacterium]|nr:FHA domain-containing protein [Actinomycetota bacterium]